MEESTRIRATASALCTHYFSGSPAAGCPQYRSLGREIERLLRALERLRDEVDNPRSSVIRTDNEVAVEETLCIALRGAKEVLENVREGLDMISVRGSAGLEEAILADMAERVGWHTWAFDLVMRALHGNQAKDLVDETLNGLFCEHLSTSTTRKEETAIIRRFREICMLQEKNLFEEFCTETAVRILMFWSYRAIRALSNVAETKQVPPAGYLDLLKAVWLLREIKAVSTAKTQIEEVRTTVALVSTEILFMFKTLVKEAIYFPNYSSILALGNFSIFPDNLILVEDIDYSTTDNDHQMALEQAILNSLTEASRSPSMNSSPSPQPPPYESLDNLLPKPPPIPLLPSPTLIRRMSTKRKKQRPLTLKTRHLNDSQSGQATPLQSSRLLTPPSSVISIDINSSSTASISGCSDSGTEELATSILSPNIENLIDEIYCDSPTLGAEECFQKPVKIEPFSPRAAHTPKIINTPQSSPEPVLVEENNLANLDERGSNYSDQFYDPPIVAQKDEHGVRPGERAIMAEEFKTMRLLSSENGAAGSWKDSTFRCFQNELTGHYRFLTIHDNIVDQRNISLQSAELFPSYAYSHTHARTLYFRKTTTVSPTFTKPGRHVATPATPASLHYRFHTLFDMFTFQQAFLHETVEADVQNVRSIRYTRGFRSGEHVAHGARVQLWKELPSAPAVGRMRSQSITPRFRKPSQAEHILVRPTRLVMYLHEVAMCVFITDDVNATLSPHCSRVLRLRPSTHRAFANPSALKVATSAAGGFRLDKDGLGVELMETFEEVKWFEIEFASEEECKAFHADVEQALQTRRRERHEAEEMRRAAERGVRAHAKGSLSLGGGLGRGKAPSLYS